MKADPQLHPAQTSVLYALRHTKDARFSELLKNTSMESDVFKFHVRKLQSLGLITKQASGNYSLSAVGKEFANRLDEESGELLKQPKPSIIMVVRSKKRGETYFLSQKRLREPFRNFWGVISAPIIAGQSVLDIAASELLKQTGIRADFVVRGSVRVIDYDDKDILLEDKLFTILTADIEDCPPPHAWYSGESMWTTRAELLARKPVFPMTSQILEFIDSDDVFLELTHHYDSADY